MAAPLPSLFVCFSFSLDVYGGVLFHLSAEAGIFLFLARPQHTLTSCPGERQAKKEGFV